MAGASGIEVRQFVVFRVGAQVFATPVTDVEGVIEPERIAPVPGADAVVRGVMNLRGRIVAVVDLASLFRLEGDPGAEVRLLILDLESTVGVLVDDVSEVVSFSDEDLQEAPSEITGGLIGVTGVVHRDDELILCLDLSEVLDGIDVDPEDAAEIQRIAS